MTGSGQFIVVRRFEGGAPKYWGPGTEDEAKAALGVLGVSEPAPEGVDYEWGIAELQTPPEGIAVDPTASFIAWEQTGSEGEPEVQTYYGPLTEGEAQKCAQELSTEPEPEHGWREVAGTPGELVALP